MGVAYRVNGTVTIVLDVESEFEDDGKTDLMDQAKDALKDSDDIPLRCVQYIEDVDAVEFEEVFVRGSWELLW